MTTSKQVEEMRGIMIKSANMSSLLQKIQMKVWDYMELPKEKRKGIKMASEIVLMVEKYHSQKQIEKVESVTKDIKIRPIPKEINPNQVRTFTGKEFNEYANQIIISALSDVISLLQDKGEK